MTTYTVLDEGGEAYDTLDLASKAPYIVVEYPWVGEPFVSSRHRTWDAAVARAQKDNADFAGYAWYPAYREE